MTVIKLTPDTGRGLGMVRAGLGCEPETAATATARSDFSHDLLFPFHHSAGQPMYKRHLYKSFLWLQWYLAMQHRK